MTFRMTMLPALDGDCVLLSWGREPDLHHVLVDLGRGVTYRAIRDRLDNLRAVELLVISHVDADHIAGTLPLVREANPPLRPKRVWFNGRPQLAAARNREPIHEPLGARQGEKLSRGIVQHGWPWNESFASEIVSTDSAEARAPIRLDGGLSLRLLSPNDEKLVALLPEWDRELEKAGIRPFDPDEEAAPEIGPRFEPLSGIPDVRALAETPYEPDETEANGSSIAFLAEFEGKRVLLAADAHAETLEAAIRAPADAEGGRLRIDLLKVSHHGSRANTSPSLLKLLDCQRFAFSTDGSRRHNHPNAETIARLLTADPERAKTLYFNYRQPHTDLWDSVLLQQAWRYACHFPVSDEADPNNGTLEIDIEARNP